MNILIVGAPGYVDRFEAKVIPGLHRITTPRNDGPVTVIATKAREILAVPSRFLFTPDGLAYAEEWAQKTGSTIYDIILPAALEVR